jgi:hypothetical protein
VRPRRGSQVPNSRLTPPRPEPETGPGAARAEDRPVAPRLCPIRGDRAVTVVASELSPLPIRFRPGCANPLVSDVTEFSAPTGCAGGSFCYHGTTFKISPDGQLLATLEPEAIHLWDLRARRPIGVIVLDAGAVDTNSAQLVMTDTSLTIDDFAGRLVVDLDPRSWERDACTIANRNLTRTEWTQYTAGVRYHKTCSSVP